MCCFISSLFLFGPRTAIVIWWLLQPARWSATFDTLLWPLVGFVLLPWTTLMYVALYPGGIDGFDYVWLAIAIGFDAFSWFGGAYTNRGRVNAYRS